MDILAKWTYGCRRRKLIWTNKTFVTERCGGLAATLSKGNNRPDWWKESLLYSNVTTEGRLKGNL